MPDWKGIVGLSFTPDQFDSYCHSLQWNAWRPSFIVLHNTAIPSLAQRPQGITQQHIQNFVSYYRDVQGWNSGPHLFVDDRQIWVFTPLTVSGTHSPSWNKLSIGVEMLGDYEQEAFDSGRGQLVQQNAVAALATLSAILGIGSDTLRLHREDPLTTHATCPGKNVDKQKVIQAVQALMVARHPGEHVIPAGQPDSPAPAPDASGTPAPEGTTPAESGTPAATVTPVPAGAPAASGTPTAAATPAATGEPAASGTPVATTASGASNVPGTPAASETLAPPSV